MYFFAVLIVLAIAGCQPKEPPPLELPPLPEDLSQFTTPTLATPPGIIPRPFRVPPREAAPNERLYHFTPATEYEIEVPMQWPMDIVLESGEVVHTIVGGDRAPQEENMPPRWEIKEGQSDTAQEAVPHIFLTATQPGLTMGLIVTTSARTYYLTVRSVKQSPIRAVRWTYPPKPVLVQSQPTLFPDPQAHQQYHVGYFIKSTGSTQPMFMPRQVLDNGRKTYIIFPPTLQYSDAPLLRLIGNTGPELVNSRQWKNIIVIDRLINQLELRLGNGPHAQTVLITRGELSTIQCPGTVDCPVWPDNL